MNVVGENAFFRGKLTVGGVVYSQGCQSSRCAFSECGKLVDMPQIGRHAATCRKLADMLQHAANWQTCIGIYFVHGASIDWTRTEVFAPSPE